MSDYIGPPDIYTVGEVSYLKMFNGEWMPFTFGTCPRCGKHNRFHVGSKSYRCPNHRKKKSAQGLPSDA